MAKNYRTTTAAQGSGKDKEYLNHVCGECKRCTPVTKFNTDGEGPEAHAGAMSGKYV